MKLSQTFGVIIGFLVLIATSVQARPLQDSIQFNGKIIDGPFKGQTINGYCKRRPLGDVYKQKTKCVFKMRGYKVVDNNASLEIVGGYRALRIILGPGLDKDGQKGNFKLSVFHATTFYDREITLFDFPRRFSAVDVSVSGVSIADGTAARDPDCLIWDIAGDGVLE